MAELKDMPVTHKPSVEIVEILNQKPQPKQAGKPADKPTAPKVKEKQLESLAQKTSEAQPIATVQKATNSQQAQLPQTGSKENSTLFTVATILLATSGGLFLLKKKEA
ncbi:LPXTG cell wall anchor domain-containing protein [uncultured Streptococcus sp.]|uniref:LPXTG cell wall anchor domain-containing protein n=1 Tax=uncultured Streptococcus sp. TaxID=83427 RepID=UPI002617D232|nr:LPXTG cell wall anchor domain-containing protein [uncultured Streptococcus sp.]